MLSPSRAVHNPRERFDRRLVELSVELKSPALIKQVKAATEEEKSQPRETNEETAPKSTLENCIESFFDTQTIECECGKCKAKMAMFVSMLGKAPPMLAIQLKRFQTVYKDDAISHKKNKDVIFWNPTVDVGASKYTITAIVNHVGELSNGHYTCFVRDGQTERWLMFNDEKTREVVDLKELVSAENYMLIFRKHVN